ncbi:MAG: 3'-5' exonuclease [Gemmatimonadaceae bacterium]
MIPSGIRASAADSLLLVRAREALATGSLDSVTLMEKVCSLPGAPQLVAERLAEALFARHDDFGRDGTGRWILVRRDRAHPTFVRAPADSVEPLEAVIPSLADRAARADRADRADRVVPPDERGSYDDDNDIPLREMRFAVVDVETTGSSPASADRITEIAIVHVSGGEVTQAFETLVNPERGIPPAIVALTQITWEMVRDAPTFSRVANDVLSGLRERVFVAHNAAFDWRFVSSELARASGLQLSGDRLCTVRLARALLPQLPRKSLDSVTQYFGVEIAARHRAMGDALATAHVLTRLIRIAEDRGATTWNALSDLLSGRAPRVRRKRSAWPRGVSIDPTL